MNEDVIADLKQFISATVSQHTADLPTKNEVQKMIDKSITDAKNEILGAIGDTMTTRDDAVDEQLSDHESRLTRLERKTV